MDKYSLFFGFIILIDTIVLAFFINRSHKRLNALLKLALNTAREHNRTAYEFSKFIVANLHDKAKNQDLTEEEQQLFHDARYSIHQYGKLHKHNKPQE